MQHGMVSYTHVPNIIIPNKNPSEQPQNPSNNGIGMGSFMAWHTGTSTSAQVELGTEGRMRIHQFTPLHSKSNPFIHKLIMGTEMKYTSGLEADDMPADLRLGRGETEAEAEVKPLSHGIYLSQIYFDRSIQLYCNWFCSISFCDPTNE